MKLIRRPERKDPLFKDGSVITIGIFDGIHLGHQALINQLMKKSEAMNLPSVFFTFEPTPNEYFSKKKHKQRLTSLRDKFNLVGHYELDYFYAPPFDQTMEILSPEDFINKHLIDLFNIKYLIIGDDFKFAKNRSGSSIDLIKSGKCNDFEVKQLNSIVNDSSRVSSSLVREHLMKNNLPQVCEILGRNYAITGRVTYGKSLGKTIGFPTANINLAHLDSALRGVFYVKVKIDGMEKKYPGIANIGFKPTVGGEELCLEIHLLDFNQDIYLKYINVEFLDYLRSEQKFNGLEELTNQLKIDTEKAIAYFSNI